MTKREQLRDEKDFDAEPMEQVLSCGLCAGATRPGEAVLGEEMKGGAG